MPLPDYIKFQLPDPLRQAREYLRLRGVAHNDLITGDHAATLLAEWTKAITDRDAQIVKLLDEYNSTQLTPIRFIPKGAAERCRHAEGRAWDDIGGGKRKCGICGLVEDKR